MPHNLNAKARRPLRCVTRWCVVSFALRPLYPQRKNDWYPLDRRGIFILFFLEVKYAYFQGSARVLT
jgi:hypothetical protein